MRHRLLGLEVGDRRIGVAVSDSMGTWTQPVMTLVRSNRRQDARSLLRVISKIRLCGDSSRESALHVGRPQPQAIKAQAFAQMLREETGLPVHLWDERLTTTEAHRHLHASGVAGSEHKKVVDQVAAVLILHAYLDAKSMQEQRLAIEERHPSP